MIKLRPWLEFFRLPNLPSAMGDALAGAAVISYLTPDTETALSTIIAAALGSLLLYMWGLADNDIVDAERDKTEAPHRPIPSGRITIGEAKFARLLCIVPILPLSLLMASAQNWLKVVAILISAIFTYNRIKEKFPLPGTFVMGMCRGLSMLSGAAALLKETNAITKPQITILSVLFLTWTLQTMSLTLIAIGEDKADAPITPLRYLPSLLPLMPVILLSFTVSASCSHQIALLTAISMASTVTWIKANCPLGKRHTPLIRRQTIGKLITTLFYLQGAYALTLSTTTAFIFGLCIIAKIIITHKAKKILGS